MSFFRTLKRLTRGRDVIFHGPATYNQDGLATKHNADFLSDSRFTQAYTAGETAGGWDSNVHWRVLIEIWAAENGLALEGDFVECGVCYGATSRAVIEYLNFGSVLGKRYLLFDTFDGLVESQITAAERSNGVLNQNYRECFAQVQDTFRSFPNVEIIRGAIPNTLAEVNIDKVAYLSIDMNCVAPEIAAAEYFWPLLSKGAFVVLDDYGWKAHIAQKKAFDGFARHRGISVLPLPTGQGLMIKPFA